jgi:HPt (histidine-containing phosphotransfer) domain-containing protein
VVVLGFFIRAAVARALAPLEQVRGEIVQRGVLRLHALDSRGMPDEVAPLVNALSDLLARLDQAMANQRRFIADAAHELRTPLTAVKLQAQIARRAETGTERDTALAQLSEGVDRAAHLVDQLLGMARLEPEARQVTFTPVALDVLVKRAVADFSAQADVRGIDLGVGACEPLKLVRPGRKPAHDAGQPARQRPALLPRRVDASTWNCARPRESRPDGLRHRARHSGLRAGRVFERFQRLAGADIPGSGLGLAIVKQVVAMHGGEVRLDDAPEGGLRVEITLPMGYQAQDTRLCHSQQVACNTGMRQKRPQPEGLLCIRASAALRGLRMERPFAAPSSKRALRLVNDPAQMRFEPRNRISYRFCHFHRKAMAAPNSLILATAEHLARFAPFDSMAKEHLIWLAERLKLAYYGKGEVLLSPDHGDVKRFYIIKQGAVQWSRRGRAAPGWNCTRANPSPWARCWADGRPSPASRPSPTCSPTNWTRRISTRC